MSDTAKLHYAVIYHTGFGWGWYAHGSYATRVEAETVMAWAKQNYPHYADTLEINEYNPHEAAHFYYPLNAGVEIRK